MSPKEKAIELVESMAFSCRECDYESNAKQCAIIAVDEILQQILWDKGAVKYWNEVKQEIQNL